MTQNIQFLSWRYKRVPLCLVNGVGWTVDSKFAGRACYIQKNAGSKVDNSSALTF
jgi:hypothetical protein